MVARPACVTSSTATDLRPRRMRRGRPRGTRGEEAAFVHALSGAASFAACLRLFRSYPLALNPSYPGDPGPASARHAAGWRGSIVLRHRGFDEPGFYVLSQHPAEHFTLRPWRAGDGAGRAGIGECQEIR